jgi:hypothetical protein
MAGRSQARGLAVSVARRMPLRWSVKHRKCLTIPDGSVRHFTVEWAEENRTLMSLCGFKHDGIPIRISGWCFNWNGFHLYPTVIDGIPDNEEMTIVGNVHDNPELMKGGK